MLKLGIFFKKNNLDDSVRIIYYKNFTKKEKYKLFLFIFEFYYSLLSFDLSMTSELCKMTREKIKIKDKIV